ncbi:FG-GAP-like repeat-containing protein [Occallatibacter riparius]|uniref:Ig-like domain repeat protein n=1 Tax=Occallatibacter riparius TaxID=1002689 RepID=A0A9J7BPM4_9BACT|nr:FG-GAP-like repeat-containing protein [Occallatibacter riparius]UWZ84551.1 Ig-like domain repeat protein [Occallatibacter riparius]
MGRLLALAALLAVPAAYAATPTTTTLAITAGGSTVTSVAPGTVVTLTATVLAGSTPVSPGLVNFCDANAAHCTDVHIVGSAQLTSAGTAVVRFRPGGGSHSYKAVFVGTATYASSASDAVSFSMDGAYLSATSVQATVNTSGTVSANIAVDGLSNREDAPASMPTGTVKLVDTSNGNAVLATQSVTPGSSAFGLSPVVSGQIQPYAAIAVPADLNGDGTPDLAVASQNAVSLSYYLGNGDGTFTLADSVPLDPGASGFRTTIVAVTAGDFNGDGIVDLAVTIQMYNYDPKNPGPYGAFVTVLLGRADGHWNGAGPQWFLATFSQQGGAGGATVAGDFDGDGNIDLAVANDGGEVAILLGNGDGTFRTPSYVSTGGSDLAAGLSVADFNQDGNQDLAVITGGKVQLLFGNGYGAFTLGSQSAPSMNDLVGMTAGDVNNDGVPDLVLNNASYSVFLGKGDGTFSPGQPIGTPGVNYGTGPAVIADFNNDGIPDLATSGQHQVFTFFGAGDGTFSQSADITDANADYVLGNGTTDFNGDGVPDLFTTQAEVLLVSYLKQSSASATFTVAPGTHNIVGQYSGDATYTASSSPVAAVQFTIQTSMSLTSSLQTALLTQPVTLTATLSPYAGYGATTDGQTVTFAISGGATLGTATLSGGTASLTLSTLPLGTSAITASYAGTAQFGASSATTSVTVNMGKPTLTLTSSSSSVLLGQSVTLTATLSGYAGNLAGESVKFSDSAQGNIGTAVLSSSGVASLVWQPSTAGLHTAVAAYAGDSNNLASTNQIPVSVLKPGQTASAVTLQVNGSSNPGSLPQGTPAVLTATVTSSGAPVAPGTVRFCDLQSLSQVCSNLAASPTAQLNATGQATVTTRLGPGPHNLVAYFTGTATAVSAESTPLAFSGGPYAAQLIQTCDDVVWQCKPSLHALAPTPVLAPTGSVDFVDQSFSNKVLGSSPPNSFLGFHFQFTQKSSSAAGTNPFSIAAADFNHDGWPDVAVTNSGDNTVGILLGNGDGTFQPQVTYAVGAGPFAVATGDFNNDGNPDLAVTNFSANTVSILLGKTDGTFQPQRTYATGGGPVAVAVGDFNFDGQLDLAIVNNLDNNVSILLGKGDGTFQPQVIYASGAAPDAIVIADFNGDQIADLAIANNGDNTVSVLLGIRDGTFQPQTAYSSGGTNPISLAAGLMSMGGVVDNNMDLIVGNTGDGAITILFGKGDGTLLAPQTIYTQPAVQAVATGTFGIQGLTDVAFASSTQNGVLADNGNGQYFAHGITQSTAIGITALAVADWDGNGASDFALVGNSSKAMIAVLNTSFTEWDGLYVPLSFSPPSGTHKVVAEYAADSNYPALASAPFTFNLNPTSTKLTLSANRNPSNYGDAVTLAATLTPYSFGSVTTDGETIRFSSGSTVLGTGTLASGVATLTTSSLPTGVLPITATYTADQFFAGSTGSMTQTVRPPTLTVTASNATRVYGTANPAFTVKVTGALNGDTFTTGAATTATQTSSPGTFNIVPSISGSSISNYNVVKVNGTLTITPAKPDIALKSSAGQVFPSTPVTFTATVSSSAGSPSGTVSFYDGSTLLNKATLAAGTATYETSSLAVGVHTITAAYSGDSNFTTIASPAVTQTIESFTITVPSGGDSATVSAGGTATYKFNVAPPSGTKFLSEIKFSVTGAPSGSTSSFNPTSIASGSGATDVTLTVKVPTSAAVAPAPSPFRTRALPIALGLLVLPWLLPVRRRARNWLLPLLLVVFGLASLGLVNGCGGGSSGGSGGGGGGQPQTYNLTVSATTGSLSQTTKLTLTVN